MIIDTDNYQRDANTPRITQNNTHDRFINTHNGGVSTHNRGVSSIRTWNSRKEKLLRFWQEECRIYSWIYTQTANRARAWRSGLKYSAIGISAISTAILSVSAPDECATKTQAIIIAAAIFTAIIFIINGLEAFGKFEDSISNNVSSARQNSIIATDIESVLSVERRERPDAIEFLNEIKDRKNKVLENAPNIHPKRWVDFNRRLERGEQVGFINHQTFKSYLEQTINVNDLDFRDLPTTSYVTSTGNNNNNNNNNNDNHDNDNNTDSEEYINTEFTEGMKIENNEKPTNSCMHYAPITTSESSHHYTNNKKKDSNSDSVNIVEETNMDTVWTNNNVSNIAMSEINSDLHNSDDGDNIDVDGGNGGSDDNSTANKIHTIFKRPENSKPEIMSGNSEVFEDFEAYKTYPVVDRRISPVHIKTAHQHHILHIHNPACNITSNDYSSARKNSIKGVSFNKRKARRRSICSDDDLRSITPNDPLEDIMCANMSSHHIRNAIESASRPNANDIVHSSNNHRMNSENNDLIDIVVDDLPQPADNRNSPIGDGKKKKRKSEAWLQWHMSRA